MWIDEGRIMGRISWIKGSKDAMVVCARYDIARFGSATMTLRR
jgi:hypothetical protein